MKRRLKVGKEVEEEDDVALSFTFSLHFMSRWISVQRWVKEWSLKRERSSRPSFEHIFWVDVNYSLLILFSILWCYFLMLMVQSLRMREQKPRRDGQSWLLLSCPNIPLGDVFGFWKEGSGCFRWCENERSGDLFPWELEGEKQKRLKERSHFDSFFLLPCFHDRMNVVAVVLSILKAVLETRLQIHSHRNNGEEDMCPSSFVVAFCLILLFDPWIAFLFLDSSSNQFSLPLVSHFLSLLVVFFVCRKTHGIVFPLLNSTATTTITPFFLFHVSSIPFIVFLRRYLAHSYMTFTFSRLLPDLLFSQSFPFYHLFCLFVFSESFFVVPVKSSLRFSSFHLAFFRQEKISSPHHRRSYRHEWLLKHSVFSSWNFFAPEWE